MTAATEDDVHALIAQYRAGLEAEIALLHRLEAIARRQREEGEAGDLEALGRLLDQRDRVTAGLVAVEHELKPIRAALVAHRSTLGEVPAFKDVAALHTEAVRLIEVIVSTDRNSLAALEHAELARRFAAQSLAQGESTLAAYRRIVAPRLPGATLVDRKG